MRPISALLYPALQLPVPSRQRERHYRENLETMKQLPPGLIEDQHTAFWRRVRYGYCPLFRLDLNASNNICGPVAVYNACQLLGLPTGPDRLTVLLRQFERKGIALRGYAGTAPDALCRYFQELGLRTRTLSGDDAVRPDAFRGRYRVFLATVIKDRRCILKGLHSVCISADDDGFRIHNAPGSSDQVYPTLRDALRNAGHNGSRRQTNSVPVAVTGIIGRS